MSEIYIRVDEKWGGPIVSLNTGVLNGDRVTDQGIRVYFTLISRMDQVTHECIEDPNELADKIGMNHVDMFRTINHLVAEGLLRTRLEDGKFMFFPVLDYLELDALDKDSRYDAR